MTKILAGLAAVVLLVAAYLLIPRKAAAPVTETATSTATTAPLTASTTPVAALIPATVKTYTSEALGVQFQYNTDQANGYAADVAEKGNKIFVYMTYMAPEKGQSVEVFSKKPDETFAESIRRQILADFPSPDCKIEVGTTTSHIGYEIADIAYPPTGVETDPWFENAALCNEHYDETNGIQYFLYDPKHPDKFLFVSIGQYGIDAYNDLLWEDTITFI